MKLRIQRTIDEDIYLSDKNVHEVTITKLKELIYPGEYLRTENGKIVLKQDDPHWRHGSVSEEYVRDATELDIAVFKVLEALYNDKKYLRALNEST